MCAESAIFETDDVKNAIFTSKIDGNVFLQVDVVANPFSQYLDKINIRIFFLMDISIFGYCFVFQSIDFGKTKNSFGRK